jgi:iron complex transport system substrate-binding protein
MRKFIVASLTLVLGLLALQLARKRNALPGPVGPSLRIISLAPNLTEILFELGVGEHVIGVTTYCVYPPEAQKKEKIGDFINPNIEKIVSLKPDLVFAERWSSTKTVARLRGMGLNVIDVPSPASIEEIYRVIRQVGEAVKKVARACEIEMEMKKKIEVIKERTRQFKSRPSIYVEIDLPSWTVGRPSFINEAVYLCGAKNLFEDIEKPAIQVSREVIIERNPEIILSLEAPAAEVRQRPGWEQIAAVKKNKIIDNVPRDLLSHGNHRLVLGMEELQAQLERLQDH